MDSLHEGDPPVYKPGDAIAVMTDTGRYWRSGRVLRAIETVLGWRYECATLQGRWVLAARNLRPLEAAVPSTETLETLL